MSFTRICDSGTNCPSRRQAAQSLTCTTWTKTRWCQRWVELSSVMAFLFLSWDFGNGLLEDSTRPNTTDPRRPVSPFINQKAKPNSFGMVPQPHTRYKKNTKRTQGDSGKASVPSHRCAGREEWQNECFGWSGEPHNRYVEFGKLNWTEGVGANLLRVHWVLNRALLFDLEPVIIGPLVAGHSIGEFGDWMGLTNNPIMAVRDEEGFKNAVRQKVPFPEGDQDGWFRERRNQTFVVYVADPMLVGKIKDWGVPVESYSPNRRMCRYAREVLRALYWSVPSKRNRCGAFLSGKYFLSSNAKSVTGTLASDIHRDSKTQDLEKRSRVWVIAVHVRRGDMIRFRRGVRSVPHAYFVATIRAVLHGIANVDPQAQVMVFVLSEGPKWLQGNQIIDETGAVVKWNIAADCEAIGLRCTPEFLLHTSLFDAFDCLAAADVIVGSESSMSEGAAAVSTNVKIMLWEGQEEQDRVTLKCDEIATAGVVGSQDQIQINEAISNWFHCYGEATHSTGFDSVNYYARHFYQTVYYK